jgi:hypothetical protein
LRLKGECNVELLLWHNNKKLITHVNRLKPYFVQKPAVETSPDFFPAEKPATPPPVAVQKEANENFFPNDEFYPWDLEVIHPDPTPSKVISLPQHCTRRR